MIRTGPMLPDPNDEMVLETAINGPTDAIVTFNKRDFRPGGPFSMFGGSAREIGQEAEEHKRIFQKATDRDTPFNLVQCRIGIAWITECIR